MKQAARGSLVVAFAAVAALGAAGAAGAPRAATPHPRTIPTPHRPDTVLVGFHPGVDPGRAAAVVARAGATDTEVIGVGTHVLRVSPGGVEAAIAALDADPAVRYAQPDYLFVPTSVPNDPAFPQQWALQNTGQYVRWKAGTPGADIDVTRAWDLTTGSASVVIGLVDDGFDYTHPDLAANAWTNPGGVNGCPAGTHGYDAVTGACDPRTSGAAAQHGTSMGLTLGAVGNNNQGIAGVNWTAAVMGVGFEDSRSSATAIKAIDWVVQAKQAGVNVRVINASFGFMGTGQADTDEIAKAGANDILVVAAAGNNAANNDTSPVYPCNYGAANEICVAATDQNDQLWSQSNYGSNSVDLAAPGVNICSGSPNDSCDASGTSEATAFVSGAAALLAAHDSSLTATQIKAAILDNVRPVPGLAGKVRTGGVLDVYCAMTNCRGTTTVLSSSANPATAGQPVSFNALVNASNGATPTGTVTFLDDGRSLGTAGLGGGGRATYTTSSLAAGTHTLTAAYGGDANHSPSTSPVLTQTVNSRTTGTESATSGNHNAPGSPSYGGSSSPDDAGTTPVGKGRGPGAPGTPGASIGGSAPGGFVTAAEQNSTGRPANTRPGARERGGPTATGRGRGALDPLRDLPEAAVGSLVHPSRVLHSPMSRLAGVALALILAVGVGLYSTHRLARFRHLFSRHTSR